MGDVRVSFDGFYRVTGVGPTAVTGTLTSATRWAPQFMSSATVSFLLLPCNLAHSCEYNHFCTWTSFYSSARESLSVSLPLSLAEARHGVDGSGRQGGGCGYPGPYSESPNVGLILQNNTRWTSRPAGRRVRARLPLGV